MSGGTAHFPRQLSGAVRSSDHRRGHGGEEREHRGVQPEPEPGRAVVEVQRLVTCSTAARVSLSVMGATEAASRGKSEKRNCQ